MFQKTIKNAAIIFAVAVSLVSCQKDDKLDQTVEKQSFVVNNGRLKFLGRLEFNCTMIGISHNDPKTIKELSDCGIDLLNSKCSDSICFKKQEYIPGSLRLVLNPEFEYQIGDTIIWICYDKKYLVYNENEQLLSQIKQNPNQYNDCNNNYCIEKITVTTLESDDRKLKDWSDAKYQYQFAQGGHWYKYVFELYKYDFGYNEHYIIPRIKFEYKNSRGNWVPAGEPVNKIMYYPTSIYINGSLKISFERNVTSNSNLEHMEYFFGPIQKLQVYGQWYAKVTYFNQYFSQGGGWNVTFY